MTKPVKTISQYVFHLLQDSLITGVPQIVQTRNVTRKVLKTLVLALCIIGFIYQTTEFMKIFWSYPTVLDIDVEYPTIIESPAITFCNLNGVRRTALCAKYSENCSSPENRTAFCSAFPEHCFSGQNLKYPTGDFLSIEQWSSREELRELGHRGNVTLSYCAQLVLDGLELLPCSRDDEIHTIVPDGNTGRRNCYTIFSSVNSSALSKYQLPVPKKKEPLFHMAFNLEPEEYLRPDREVGVIVGIHSPNNIINPFFNGFVIQPGRLYTVHLKVVEEKLLPLPYDTQCKDYKAAWMNRGGKGPLSQEMCVSECVFNASMKQCSCAIPDILYLHEERTCNDDELDCFTFDISKCYEECPQPCDFTDFEYDVQERKLEDAPKTSIEDLYSVQGVTKSRAAVLIFLKRPEIIVYSHRPQYEEIEVFSFLGGYVGMWLGITLVAVYDFFETIVLIAVYWLRRRITRR